MAFVDANYLTRRYCLLEFRLALSALEAAFGDERESAREESLRHVVATLPDCGAEDILDALPPNLRTQKMTRFSETSALASMVRERLASVSDSIARRLGPQKSETLLQLVRNETSLPPVLPGPSAFSDGVPHSMGDGFVGRADDLWRLDFALSTGRPEKPPPSFVVLTGLAGLGKSQLATEYVRRLGPTRFPQGVFWIDASAQYLSLEEQLHAILRKIDPAAPGSSAFAVRGFDVRAALRSALTQGRRAARTLFVVDGVPGSAPNRPLRWWCPTVGLTAVLVTSQQVPLGQDPREPAPREVRLGALPRACAAALLSQDLEQLRADPSTWEAIASWVGDLPLALRLLNRHLYAGGSLEEVKALASNHSQAATHLELAYSVLKPLVPAGALRGIADAFESVLASLSPTTVAAAETLAYLSPAPIPTLIVDRLDVPQAARAELKARSIVAEAASGSVEIFGRMHRILADFIRMRLKSRSSKQGVARLLDCILPRRYESGARCERTQFRRLCSALEGVLRAGSRAQLGPGAEEEQAKRAAFPHAEWIFHLGLEHIREFGVDVSNREHFRRLRDSAGHFLQDGRTAALVIQNDSPLRPLPPDAMWRALTEEEARLLVDHLRSVAVAPDQRGGDVQAMNLPNLLTHTYAMARAYAALENPPIPDRLACERINPADPTIMVLAFNRATAGLAEGGELSAGPSDARLRNLFYVQETYEIRRYILGPGHIGTLSAGLHLAAGLAFVGSFVEASQLYREIVQHLKTHARHEDTDLEAVLDNLALMLACTGDAQSVSQLCRHHPGRNAALPEFARSIADLYSSARQQRL